MSEPQESQPNNHLADVVAPNQPSAPLPIIPGNVGSNSSGEKRSWPELVGVTPEEAEKKIKEEISEKISVQVVPPNSFVTMDYRLDRIRIFVDATGKVARPPKLG